MRARQAGKQWRTARPFTWVTVGVLCSTVAVVLLLAWIPGPTSPTRITSRSSTDEVLPPPAVHTRPEAFPAPNAAAAGTGAQNVNSAGALPNLPERADAKCNGLGTPLEVFSCRQHVAQQAALKACEALQAAPPEPPFVQAQLRVSSFSSRHSDGRATVPIAVESSGDIVSAQIRTSGIFELHDVATVMEALSRVEDETGQTEVLLDIGANLGLYSFVAAALGYNVVAFEAMPRNVEALYQTLCWNPDFASRVTVFPYGLGESQAACRVMSRADNVADGHVICTPEQYEVYRNNSIEQGVTHMVRLDDYAGALGVRVVKMDVEGFEPLVLAGAGDALRETRFALSELNLRDMAGKMPGSIEQVVADYLQSWQSRGFGMRICSSSSSCFASALMSSAQVTNAATTRGIVNILFERTDTAENGGVARQSRALRTRSRQ